MTTQKLTPKQASDFLAGTMAYLIVTVLWFFYAIPELFDIGSSVALWIALVFTCVWLAVTASIAFSILFKMSRPA